MVITPRGTLRSIRFLLTSLLGLAFATLTALARSPNALTAQHLLTIRDIGGLSLSPDGRWVAFQVRRAHPQRNSYSLDWYVASIDGGSVVRIADGGDPIQQVHLGRINGHIVTPPAAWSPDSSWVAFLRSEDGHAQAWRSRRDGYGVEQVTHNSANVRSLVYSRDGRRLLFEVEPSKAQIASALAEEGEVGYLYDRRFVPSYSRRPVFPADAVIFEGVFRLRSDAQIGARRVWADDLSNGHERPATEAEQAEFAVLTRRPEPTDRPTFRSNAASSRGGLLAWTEARDPERSGHYPILTIVAQSADAREPVACSHRTCTGQRIRDLWWRSNTEIVFARGEGVSYQETALYAWRIGPHEPRLILRTTARFTSDSNWEWRCEIALDQLICFYEEPNHPRRLVAIDLSSGLIRTLYDPNPDFTQFDLGPPPRRLEVRTDSGIETYGYLVLPPRYRPGVRLPLVIVTYRCSGFLRGGTGDEYPVFPLAAEGFAVFCFDAPTADYVRGARENTESYIKWTRGPGDPEKRRVQMALEAAIDRLTAMGLIDPDRIGITGLSFGAETVGYALFQMPRLAAAITSGPPGFESTAYYLAGPTLRGTISMWGYGAPDATADRWRSVSLAANVNQVRAPLLINAADSEFLEALQPLTALQSAARSVEMYVFPREYHIKHQPAHRLAIYDRNIDWMNFWLRGVEDADPAKAQQYRRWRDMRENVQMLRRSPRTAGE